MLNAIKVPLKLASVVAVFILSGCAATQTMVAHRHLEVQTKTSQSIFLPPVKPAEKTIYVAVKNTSDQTHLIIQPQLETDLKQKGYTITQDPNAAHYILQANVLQVGRLSETAAQQALLGGFGSSVAGAAVGAYAGSVATDGSGGGTLAGGLIGSVVTSIADSAVKDVTYSMVTDVQIQARLPKGETAQSTTTSQVQQGSATQTKTRLSDTSSFQTYRTRLLSSANKVNLKFDEAEPVLAKQVAHSIAGLF
ncbi:MAG: complement resistance protein TraT [Pseudomonadota bacterium]